MWGTQLFVFHGPTPAIWPKGSTLKKIGGPCLSPSTRLRIDSASWPVLPSPAFTQSHKARRGVTGFGSFPFTTTVAPSGTRQATSSPAGAKPGNTENHVDTRVGDISAMRSPASAFSTGTTQDGFPINIVKLSGQNHILRMIP
jgi:hypothetical protein